MVKLNKIYTHTGDKGSAGLVDGSRVSKSSLRMTAIGEVDEANAAIGVAIAALEEGPTAEHLREIHGEIAVRPEMVTRIKQRIHEAQPA